MIRNFLAITFLIPAVLVLKFDVYEDASSDLPLFSLGTPIFGPSSPRTFTSLRIQLEFGLDTVHDFLSDDLNNCRRIAADDIAINGTP